MIFCLKAGYSAFNSMLIVVNKCFLLNFNLLTV